MKKLADFYVDLKAEERELQRGSLTSELQRIQMETEKSIRGFGDSNGKDVKSERH